MSRIYWDTMLFVYWIEDNPRYAPRVLQILENMSLRQDQLCTSAFTAGEVLTGPIKFGSPQIAGKIRNIFQSPLVEVLPYTLETSEFYAEIRATHRISAADAIHLASAAEAKTDLFLTNDKNLVGKVIPGIQFIAGLDSNII
jgi:predicted nucleic acid-binding protein